MKLKNDLIILSMTAVVNKFYTNKKLWGILSCLAISLILLIIFFGSILQSPNSTYFSGSGDGLKSTFGSVYHLKYDSTLYRTQYMNYPFGESIFYTGSQPLIVNIFKSFKNKGLDFSDSILGILNIWMLLSIVLAALFLYLIFRELKLPIIYAIIAANIIAFMSPQLDRFGGHYNLAYVHFIPLMIYLFLRFYKNRNSYTSVFLGLTALYSLYTHIYFFGFFTFILIALWIALALDKSKDSGKTRFIINNVLIQFIFPLLLFQLLLWNAETAYDRTTYPWGFFALSAYLQDILLPIHLPYGQFLGIKGGPWEGFSYIGLLGLGTLIFILVISIKKISKKWKFLRISDQKFLNLLFGASLLALLFSLGMPFNLGLNDLYNYMGPLKGFRAPGRYAWLFFYTLNIIAFYLVWRYYERKKSLLAVVILILCVGWSSYDAFLNVQQKENRLNNKIESLSDRENKLPINEFMHQIDFDKYQAIISLPYFHIGSENYWIEGTDAIKKRSFIVSMKTGLPLVSVMMGRTSMSQTVMNMQLFMEPYNNHEYLEHLNSTKPFLIILDKKYSMQKEIQVYTSRSKLIYADNDFEYREIDVQNIAAIVPENKKDIAVEIDSFKCKDYILHPSDSTTKYFYMGSNFPHKKLSEKSNCLFNGDLTQKNIILNAELIGLNEGEHTLSFWIENMDKDMYPRSELIIELYDEKGNNYKWIGFQLWRHIKIINKDRWGLVEVDLPELKANSSIEIHLQNKLLIKANFKVDEILIRPDDIDIYSKSDKFCYKNNRFYTR